MVGIIVVAVLLLIAIAFWRIAEIFLKNILACPFQNVSKDKGAREFNDTLTQVNITSFDGLKLNGMYRFHEEKTHRYVISIHGYKDDHFFMLPYGKAFYEKGYNVLLPDDRGHGESEGSYIGMGWLDKEDIKKWIEWILAQDPEARIVLHGVSMGAATTMMLSGENLEHVDGYIEDCGYTSVWDIFATVMNRDYHLPTFPIMNICDLLCQKRAGYGYKEASSINQLKKCKKPMLFIHGEADRFIPVDMCYQNYEAFQGEKAIYIVADADHADALDVDPKTYFNEIFSFIEKKIGWKED